MSCFTRDVWDRGDCRKATVLLLVVLTAFVQCQVPALVPVDDDEAGLPLPSSLEFSILGPAAFAMPFLARLRLPQAGPLLSPSLKELVSRGPASFRSPPPIA